MKKFIDIRRRLGVGLLCASLLALSACAVPSAPAAGAGEHHGPSGEAAAAFRLSGAVQKPRSVDLATLRAMPASKEQVDGHSYVGVSLWSLLNAEGGMNIPATPRNASLAYYVVATGSDGYQVVFSLPEIDPAVGDRAVLVAYELDGAPLGRSGMARLMVPADKKRGRAVANLVAIEVRSSR